MPDTAKILPFPPNAAKSAVAEPHPEAPSIGAATAAAAPPFFLPKDGLFGVDIFGAFIPPILGA